MRSWFRRPSLAIASLVVLAYLPALGAGFIWCDDYTVRDSPLLHGLAGLRHIWAGGAMEQYYPVTYTVYWLVAQVVGLAPMPFHLLNLLLHALNALLLLHLLRRLEAPGAVLAAFVFALHPIQVESVAWIYELRNVLSTCLLLVTALLQPRHLIAALVCFALALLSKSAVVVYPAIAWLLLPAGTPRRRILSLVPFVLLAALMAHLAIWYEHHFTQARGSEWPQSLGERVAIAGHVFWFYLGKLVWPYPLAFAYRRFAVDPHDPVAYLPALAALVVLALLVALRRRRVAQVTLRALSLYAIAVFPVLGFFNIYMMRYTFVADHLAYLPSLVLIPFAAAALARAPRWLSVALVVVLALLTCARAMLFRSEERLWHDAIAHGHDTWLARVNLGLLAKRTGNEPAAISEFETALAMKDTADARVDLANMLAARGDLETAIIHYQRALELAPDDLGARHSFASALARAGHLEAALLQYQRILARDPSDQLAQRNRAALLHLLNP